MPHCMTIGYFLQKAVTEHKATYSDDHTRDFIDIYLKEMKKREKTEEISFFSGKSSFLVLSVTYTHLYTNTDHRNEYEYLQCLHVTKTSLY